MNHKVGLGELYEAAQDAVNLEYGTDAQVNAINAFGDGIQERLTPAAFKRFEVYALKATTQEMIDYGWKLLDQPRARRRPAKRAAT